MHHPRSLSEIVDNGLCLGCGLCQAIAGRDQVAMDWVDPPGRLRPVIRQRLDEASERAILATCPGMRLDGAPDPVRHADTVAVDPAFGPWIRVWKGHARDESIRHMASSGGALTALAIHLLEGGTVDFISHVRADENRPMRSRSHVSRTRDDVLAAFGTYDVLIMPTSGRQAVPLIEDPPVTSKEGSSRLPFMRTNTFNLSSAPAISVPCGFGGRGLPVGLQIAGPPGGEEMVLRMAHAYEQNTDWHNMRPPTIGI